MFTIIKFADGIESVVLGFIRVNYTNFIAEKFNYILMEYI